MQLLIKWCLQSSQQSEYYVEDHIFIKINSTVAKQLILVQNSYNHS